MGFGTEGGALGDQPSAPAQPQWGAPQSGYGQEGFVAPVPYAQPGYAPQPAYGQQPVYAQPVYGGQQPVFASSCGPEGVGLLSADQPGFGAGPFFRAGPREVKDRRWWHALCVFYSVTLLYGIIVASEAGSDKYVAQRKLNPQDYYSCHAGNSTGTRRMMLDNTAVTAKERIFATAVHACIVAAVLAVPVGLGFVSALRTNAPMFVKAAVYFKVLAPALLGFILLGIGAVGPGVVCLLLSAFIAFVMYLWRNELALCGRLLGVAGAALSDNGHLVSGSLVIQAMHTLVAIPIIATAAVASQMQVMVPNADAVLVKETNLCNIQGNAADCCALTLAPASGFYYFLATILCSWMTFLAFELRLFTIAHVVLRWYALPLGAKLQGTPVREALAAGMGPQLGSLSFGSAVMAICDMMREAAERSRRQGGILAAIMAILVTCISEMVKLMSRFATIRLAATGESFMDAARSVIALMERNMLSTYAVWSFPPMVLGFTSFVFALLGCAGTSGIFHGVGRGILKHYSQSSNSTLTDVLWVSTAWVAAISFILFFIVVSFLASTVISIVDVVYVAWATDLDQAKQTRPEVHAVFNLMPSVRTGAVVQQPDGEIGYAPGAAPAQAQAQRY
jgi:hypothetical protein